MSIYKSHNKSLLSYHLLFPAKYRRKIFTQEVGERLKEICIEIEKCYEIRFVEIGMEEDHVHFLVQSIPKLVVTRIVTIIKSITVREIFLSYPRIKKEIFWGGALWTSRYYANTVGLVCKQRNNNKIHTKSRTGKARTQTDIRKSAGARLWLITGSRRSPCRLRRGDSVESLNGFLKYKGCIQCKL